jgi:hypothetical protein
METQYVIDNSLKQLESLMDAIEEAEAAKSITVKEAMSSLSRGDYGLNKMFNSDIKEMDISIYKLRKTWTQVKESLKPYALKVPVV